MSVEDNMHMFDERRNIDGAVRLAAGIIRQAKADYTRGKYKYRKDVENFLKSEWYILLTNMDNGAAALKYWEELRRKELGEGDVKFKGNKIFLIEGLYSHNSKYVHILAVKAKNKKDAKKKARDYGICDNIPGIYDIIELHGVNAKLKTKIEKSDNDIILIKSDTF